MTLGAVRAIPSVTGSPTPTPVPSPQGGGRPDCRVALRPRHQQRDQLHTVQVGEWQLSLVRRLDWLPALEGEEGTKAKHGRSGHRFSGAGSFGNEWACPLHRLTPGGFWRVSAKSQSGPPPWNGGGGAGYQRSRSRHHWSLLATRPRSRRRCADPGGEPRAEARVRVVGNGRPDSIRATAATTANERRGREASVASGAG